MTHPMSRSQQHGPRTDFGIGQPNSVRRNTVPHFLFEIGFGKDTIGQRPLPVNINAEDFNRPGDILQVLSAKFATFEVDLAVDKVQHLT